MSQGAISSYLSATANLIPEDQVKVLAEAEGRVVSLTVEEGDTVRKGQVLASLAREDALIAVQKAEVKAKNTGLVLERGTRMQKDQLLAAEAYDKLTMEHNIAREELAEARWRLGKTTIHAPFDGRLTVRSVRIGQHIRPGDELFTVADFEPLVAYVFFPERDVLGLDSGKPVRITLKADEKVQFQGRIRQVSPVVDPATGTVKVTVEAVEVPKEVRPGGFVTVDVVRETRPGAVLVPRTGDPARAGHRPRLRGQGRGGDEAGRQPGPRGGGLRRGDRRARRRRAGDRGRARRPPGGGQDLDPRDRREAGRAAGGREAGAVGSRAGRPETAAATRSHLDDRGWLSILTLIAALGCGLIAGVFFAFSSFVMKALGRINPAAGIAAMQSINIVVINPLFMAAFIGTAAACAVLAVGSLMSWGTPGAEYLLAGSLLYFFGTFVVTIAFNVPRNNALAKVNPASPEGGQVWADYLVSWTNWNTVRTVAALGGAGALTMALVKRA